MGTGDKNYEKKLEWQRKFNESRRKGAAKWKQKRIDKYLAERDDLPDSEDVKELAENDGDTTLIAGHPTYESLNKAHRKKKKSKIRPYSKKMQKIKQDEGKAMREFWESKEDYRGWCQCEESGVWLRGYAAMYVHHIWGKGAGPAARCDKDNFIILSAKAHDQAHRDESKMKVGKFMKKRRQEMKMKYAKLAMNKAS